MDCQSGYSYHQQEDKKGAVKIKGDNCEGRAVGEEEEEEKRNITRRSA